MQLYAALGASLIQIKGHVPETGAAWTNALECAERLDDAEYQLRALWGLWSYRLSRGEHRAAQTLAQRFSSLAANTADPARAPSTPPAIGAATGIQLYSQSEPPLPAMGRTACAIRGLRSRAGLIA